MSRSPMIDSLRPTERRVGRGRRVAGCACLAGAACAGALWGVGCSSGLADLEVVSASERAHTAVGCRQLFPPRPWRATHVIDATLPLGQRATLIGAVASEEHGFRSALLTQEGFVLLDVKYLSGEVEVLRAVSPVNRDGFAASMATDIDLLMQEPEGPLVQVGRATSGEPACRWHDDAETLVEVRLAPQGAELLRYDARGQLLRRATLGRIGADGIAHDMTIEAPGTTGYRLEVRRLEPTEDPP